MLLEGGREGREGEIQMWRFRNISKVNHYHLSCFLVCIQEQIHYYFACWYRYDLPTEIEAINVHRALNWQASVDVQVTVVCWPTGKFPLYWLPWRVNWTFVALHCTLGVPELSVLVGRWNVSCLLDVSHWDTAFRFAWQVIWGGLMSPARKGLSVNCQKTSIIFTENLCNYSRSLRPLCNKCTSWK